MVYVRGKSGKVGQFQKFMPLFLGPFIVTKVDRYTVLIRDMHSGKLRNVNINRLKPTPFSQFHLDPSAFQEKELPVAPVLVPDRELEHVPDDSPPALDFDEDESAELRAVGPPSGDPTEPEPVLQDVGPNPAPVVLMPEPEEQSVPEPEPEGLDAPERVETAGPPALPPRTLPVVPVPSSGRGAVSRIVSNSCLLYTSPSPRDS